MSKRKRSTKAIATATASTTESFPVVRTVFAQDGAKLEFGISTLWTLFENECRRLNAAGIKVPEDIVKWHARYATVVRVNGGKWEQVDLGPQGTADA